MRNENHNTPATVTTGAFAGIIGGFALAGADQAIYSLTSPKKIAQETEIEPKNPYIVFAEKLEKLTHRNLNDSQKKMVEQYVSAALSAAAGVCYTWLASKWKLNWVMGGIVFGGLFWAVEDEGISPILGLAGDITKYPAEAHLRGLAAHVIFGTVTAAFVQAAANR